MNYQTRLTVDIDSYTYKWQMRAVRAWYELKRIADRVDVHISSSGAGIHLIAWFEDDEPEYIHRERLGDDRARLDLDRERGKHDLITNVSWQSKHGNDGEKDRDFSDIWDALDHINESVPMASRLKESVRRGLVV